MQTSSWKVAETTCDLCGFKCDHLIGLSLSNQRIATGIDQITELLNGFLAS
jgi:hypothetical protein